MVISHLKTCEMALWCVLPTPVGRLESASKEQWSQMFLGFLMSDHVIYDLSGNRGNTTYELNVLVKTG